MILRYIIMVLLGLAVVSLLRRFLFGTPGKRQETPRDSSKEVHNASFKEEDIQDAKFKDM